MALSWDSIVNAGKAAIGSSVGQSALELGSDYAKSKLVDMSGFEDVTSQSPVAPLEPPKPAPAPEKSNVTSEPWFWPAVVGVVVFVAFFISRKGNK